MGSTSTGVRALPVRARAWAAKEIPSQYLYRPAHTVTATADNQLSSGAETLSETSAGSSRPKKNPAVIRISAAAYDHQIGTASASLSRMNRPIAIIASDAAKHTAPTAVQIVGNSANSAAHTIAVSTTM